MVVPDKLSPGSDSGLVQPDMEIAHRMELDEKEDLPNSQVSGVGYCMGFIKPLPHKYVLFLPEQICC